MPRMRGITKTVPWDRLLEVARAAPLVKKHWGMLTPAERSRLQQLVLKSKGKPSNLSVNERLTVRRLVRKLELANLGRDLAMLARTARKRK